MSTLTLPNNFKILASTLPDRKSFFKRIRSGETPANAEMTFIDHLEALRWHLVRAVIAWLLGAIAVFIDVIASRLLIFSLVLIGFSLLQERAPLLQSCVGLIALLRCYRRFRVMGRNQNSRRTNQDENGGDQINA